MSHIAPSGVGAIALAVSLLTSMVGAGSAITMGILNARRIRPQAPQGPASAFVAAGLFAAMAGAMIYQGVSSKFPPAFVGAAIFAAGMVIALRMALRKPLQETPAMTPLASGSWSPASRRARSKTT